MARHAAVALSLVTGTLATERALATLRAGDDERQRFVSTVAHELRTPLTGLSRLSRPHPRRAVEDRAVEREFLERGRTIVGSMAGLVGDLLELSRLESGIALARDPSVLGRRGASRRSMPRCSRSRWSAASTSDHGPAAAPARRARRPTARRADPHEPRRQRRQVRRAGRRVVELAGWFDGSVAVVAVRDEGAGIDADDRPRIFERFYRMAAHERITGTGLGLPIARDLARTMGGELDVASQVGGGSSFVLALPGPGVATPAERIAATIAATLAAETERLRTIAFLRERDRRRRAAGPRATRRGPAAEPTSSRSSDRAPPRVVRCRRGQAGVRLGRSVSAPAR